MKYNSEMNYWVQRYINANGIMDNSHYKPLFLDMAAEPDDQFLSGKVVADFGCGPRGSLQWVSVPCVKIGIDVLATEYHTAFGASMHAHGMIYVTSTENVIPLPTDYVDVMFTLNSMDHVNNFEVMAAEVLRTLKPGGLFVGSFNLHEPVTDCEPQTLTEESVRSAILKHLNVESYRIAIKHPKSAYKFLMDGKLATTVSSDEQYVLWVKGHKKDR